MRFVKGSRASLFLCLLALLLPSQAHALEVPTLTWENGKSQSVVLGGETASLAWKIYLQGEKIRPLSFTRSQESDAGFYVFTVALSRDFSPGAYTVVAIDSQGSSTLLAGVQVVDRFEYDILEIPLDLYFTLLLLVAFLALQISLKTWIRRTQVDEEVVDSYSPSPNPWERISEALFAQRMRWQSRWLGEDDYLVGEIPPPRQFLALIPIPVLVIALYAVLQDSFFPLEEFSASLLLATMAAVALWDRHSGRLIFITYLTIFIVFNSTLNAPTLLSLTLLLALFLAPRYVGDVVYSFFARSGSGDWRTQYSAIFFSTMAVGLSAFWLYLLSESTIQSDNTAASRVTIVAIMMAISQFLRAMKIKLVETRSSILRDEVQGSQTQVVALRSIGVCTLIACGVLVSWTGDIASSILVSLILFGSLLSVHLQLSSSSEAFSRIWSSMSPLLPVAAVMALSAAVIMWLSRLPEVVVDRSHWVLLLSGIPLAIFALLQMFVVVTWKKEQL